MELALSRLNEWVAAMRRLVDRCTRKPARHEGRPAHGHHKTLAEKKRLAEVAPCAEYMSGD